MECFNKKCPDFKGEDCKLPDKHKIDCCNRITKEQTEEDKQERAKKLLNKYGLVSKKKYSDLDILHIVESELKEKTIFYEEKVENAMELIDKLQKEVKKITKNR